MLGFLEDRAVYFLPLVVLIAYWALSRKRGNSPGPKPA